MQNILLSSNQYLQNKVVQNCGIKKNVFIYSELFYMYAAATGGR